MSADTSAQPARTYSPTSKLPVASLSQPTVIGPMRPPRLPTELIPAIAAAAAVPLRNVEGSGQNGEAHFRCADRRLLAGDLANYQPDRAGRLGSRNEVGHGEFVGPQ